MNIRSTTNQERLITLDIIRGFALLGILFANMATFKSPTFQSQSMPSELATLPTGILNQWSQFALDLFVNGKFYPMFSFLFGLGFYLFYERLQEKGLASSKMYQRRMVFLLVIGFIHLVFIWSGDILFTYALAGFFLLLFIHRTPKTIMIWALGLLLTSSIVMGFLSLVSNFIMVMQQNDSFEEQAQAAVANAQAIYSSGTYMEILNFRLSDEVPIVVTNLILSVPNVLGLFLIGLYVGKKGWIQNPAQYQAAWKKLFFISLISGGLLSFLFAFLNNGLFPTPAWFSAGAASGLNIVAGPLFMLFYVTGAVLLCQRKAITRFFKPIAFVGQMALTNYLLQSIICSLIFYGFGLQLYGTIDTVTGLLITVVIYIGQIMLSWFWMGNYSQGPLEKLWRYWTYQKSAKQ
ncbi:uncharacterized protein J2S78_001135 [Salibacterium salarium]|uniref:DUF418 domain-containing protein n=1 Tax=Salibacterium salarium TaxID=284579 RepID=UPI00277E88AC|nr:DUF418 domain-containing protein [Salibacterium salarium]MDQ0298727.1 uncharacterized protein [Salibacterium salarium]